MTADRLYIYYEDDTAKLLEPSDLFYYSEYPSEPDNCIYTSFFSTHRPLSLNPFRKHASQYS
jgi:hypothetical protein